MRHEVAPGGVFPDYELLDHTGKLRKFSELQGDDPLILTWRAATTAQKNTNNIWNSRRFTRRSPWRIRRSLRFQLTTITRCKEFRASVGAQWTFLSDPDRMIQKDLDIQEYTDREHNPMIPHTLVLRPGLLISSIYNGYWFWGRPAVVDLWHDLRSVTSQIRPDWDLSAPGLREAWNAGDLSRFHGWNRRASVETPSIHRKS